MHFKSALEPHPQLKLVNKFGYLNSIKLINTIYNGSAHLLVARRAQTELPRVEIATLIAKKITPASPNTFSPGVGH